MRGDIQKGADTKPPRDFFIFTATPFLVPIFQFTSELLPEETFSAKENKAGCCVTPSLDM